MLDKKKSLQPFNCVQKKKKRKKKKKVRLKCYLRNVSTNYEFNIYVQKGVGIIWPTTVDMP